MEPADYVDCWHKLFKSTLLFNGFKMLPPAETQLDIKLMITSASLTSLLCVILASFISTPVLNTQHLNCFTDLILDCLDCLDCVWSEESVKSQVLSLSPSWSLFYSHINQITLMRTFSCWYSHTCLAQCRVHHVSHEHVAHEHVAHSSQSSTDWVWLVS